MSERRRIFYLIGTLDVGGAEGQFVRLVTSLDRRLFDPYVCALAGEGPLIHVLNEAGIPFYTVGFRGFRIFRHPHRVAAQLWRLYRLIRRIRPHIVHAFLFWAYVIGAFAGRAARVPIVIASRRSLGFFKEDKRLLLALEQLANRRTDWFVANSEAVRSDVIRREGIQPSRISVIHNGVDIARFSKPPDSALRSALRMNVDVVVGVVANFIYYKGYEYFFEAWETVHRHLPDAVALLIGDGPTRASFEACARSRGIDVSIRFLGQRSDVPDLLGVIDVLVHPSTQEGFSNAIVEAMAAGRPVIATDVGGNVEAVVHEETGLIVPARDAQALASSMLRLLTDKETRERFGRAGRARVERKFALQLAVRGYERLYERLCAEIVRGD